ncbi:AmmeMemoRadiSam system protein A [Marinobacterium rhizophilum]|uniref:AmmeMemoRadiSam system protein A n=1 Tax=Marinobacterium rhizophilum TaxID=420402 RepID=UPI000A05B501|nr:AmmeMemoRadiSam system protein A [Marinobacterium rhizophilum]
MSSTDARPACSDAGGRVPESLQLNRDLCRRLLDVARQAIIVGAESGQVLEPDLEHVPKVFREPGASFVTLYRRMGQERLLRGCVGSLEPRRPLLQDVAFNAYCSAFKDRRFAPVTPGELSTLELELSILSPLVALHFTDEADLLRQLVAGEDGLVIECGEHRGTFLPSVWGQLPNVDDFWIHLKHKAGLAADFWSPKLRCWRYRVLKIREAEQVEFDDCEPQSQ